MVRVGPVDRYTSREPMSEKQNTAKTFDIALIVNTDLTDTSAVICSQLQPL